MPQGSPSIRSGNLPVDILNGSSPNGSRSSGKGRRRRAAAEQRRAEQERWNELNEDGDDEIESFVLSRSQSSLNSQSRRRNRRAQRRALMYNEYNAAEDYIPVRQTPSRLNFSGDDLEMALAMSLSLSESQGIHLSGAELVSGSDLDMSYENLVMLESVPCVLPTQVVDSLPVTKFCEECDNQIVCTICQTEFVEGDQIMNLTCSHSFHNECAREWFLNYSKKCPICKCDVMETTTEK